VVGYAHGDKQPVLEAWRRGLDPWTPLRRGRKLFGRGLADDGYGLFALMGALMILQQQEVDHRTCVCIIEFSEESGSVDLPAYLKKLRRQLANPSLIVCLDSGAGDYGHLWLTGSLRGVGNGFLEVKTMLTGKHSGEGTNIVADTSRITRHLLDRIEDSATGRIIIPGVDVEIPEDRMAELRAAAEAMGDNVWKDMPLLPGVRPMSDDPLELLLNRTWRAGLTQTGIAGIPGLDGGNVLRPSTTTKLSMRFAPTADAHALMARMKEILEADPPYGAQVTFTLSQVVQGWTAPEMPAWLAASAAESSQAFFGRLIKILGEGGSIPFMKMMSDYFPGSPLFITGLLGPGANAHAPNESLDLPTVVKLTATIAKLLADDARR
jgi:acetylornithine deacetylase/succinyl-diaminopimelate desuccinylase-like protein